MNKTNTKSIIFALGTLVISSFAFMAFPAMTFAEGGYNYVYNSYAPTTVRENNNPAPTINSISPSSSDISAGTKNITITGEGFVPSSTARINGSNRTTTFIDGSHLLIQVTGNDMYTYRNDGGFYITVFNPTPAGGYSNTSFFTIKNSVNSATSNTNTRNNNITNTNNTSNNNWTDSNQTINRTNDNDNYSDLASNAIFGSNGFMPSGLIQWVFIAIIVLLIVILVRRVYGKEKYLAVPLKHD